MTEDFDSMVSKFLDVCGSDNLTAQYAVEEGMKRNSDIDAIIAHYFDAGCPRAPPDYLGPSVVAHGSTDSKIPDESDTKCSGIGTDPSLEGTEMKTM